MEHTQLQEYLALLPVLAAVVPILVAKPVKLVAQISALLVSPDTCWTQQTTLVVLALIPTVILALALLPTNAQLAKLLTPLSMAFAC